MAPSDYKRAYDTAKQELAMLLAEREQIDKRVVLVRKSLHTFAELCESEGIEVEPSAQAESLLEDSSLADEIRTVLAANYGFYFRASWIKEELHRLGHDLSKYNNPQSTIQMVLKRMVQSGDVQTETDNEGKAIYTLNPPKWAQMAAESLGAHPARRLRNRSFYGEVPNPFGKNLREMLTEPKKKK